MINARQWKRLVRKSSPNCHYLSQPCSRPHFNETPLELHSEGQHLIVTLDARLDSTATNYVMEADKKNCLEDSREIQLH